MLQVDILFIQPSFFFAKSFPFLPVKCSFLPLQVPVLGEVPTFFDVTNDGTSIPIILAYYCSWSPTDK